MPALRSSACRLPTAIVLLLASAGLVRAQGPMLLVVNKAENSLAALEPTTGRVLWRVATGDGPHEVALSPDGRTAYVTNYGARGPGNSLSVIDAVAGKEIRRVDLGPLLRPHGVIAPRASGAYFTCEGARVLAHYDLAANAVDWIMGTGEAGTHMIVATAGAWALFTANIGSDSISWVQKTAGPQPPDVSRIPVGKGPEAIDLSPGGKELWTAHSRDGGLSVIDTATGNVAQTFDIGTKRSNRLRFTLDGRLVLVSDLDAGDIIVIDAAARKIVKRLPVGRAPSGILMVPDGTRAYVALTGENALAIIDLKTLAVTGRIPTGQGPDGMAWRR